MHSRRFYKDNSIGEIHNYEHLYSLSNKVSPTINLGQDFVLQQWVLRYLKGNFNTSFQIFYMPAHTW